MFQYGLRLNLLSLTGSVLDELRLLESICISYYINRRVCGTVSTETIATFLG